MQQKTYETILWALGIALVIGSLYLAGVYFNFFSSMNTKEYEEYQKKLTEAASSHTGKNYDGAIQQLQEVLVDAPNATDAANLKVRLAFNYLNKGLKESEDNADITQAMNLLWTVAFDTNVPAQIRARTFADLGAIAIEHDPSFYERNYTSPVVRGFLTDKNAKYASAKAALKLFEYSNTIYSNSYANYYEAEIYTTFLINKALPVGMSDKDLAVLIQEKIKEGDTYFDQEVTAGLHSDSMKIRFLSYRANDLAHTGKLLKNLSIQEREEAYKKTLKVAEAIDENDLYAADLSMLSRYYYAGFLVTNSNEYPTDRSSEVEEIMKPFQKVIDNPENYTETRYKFVSRNTPPYTAFVQQLSIKVSEKSPEFKAFLTSIGWKL